MQTWLALSQTSGGGLEFPEHAATTHTSGQVALSPGKQSCPSPQCLGSLVGGAEPSVGEKNPGIPPQVAGSEWKRSLLAGLLLCPALGEEGAHPLSPVSQEVSQTAGRQI